jgi:TolB protein
MRRERGRLAAWLIALLACTAVRADDRPEIVVSDPTEQRFRAAVQRFAASSPLDESAQIDELRQHIGAALEYSSLFDSMDPKAFVGGDTTIDLDGVSSFVCSDWNQIGADVLLEGEVSTPDGELLVEYRVRDVPRCKSLQRKKYRGRASNLKLVAARIADDVVMALTGRPGVASTEIAFISNRSATKELYVMDASGADVRAVTRNGSINTFPSWAPDGSAVLYTSYRQLTQPGLFVVQRGGGAPRRVFADAAGGGAQYRGTFSPDGKRVALVISVANAPEIFTARRDARDLRRLTNHPAIDISPTWSPDSKRIAFVSDRAGGPQVYVMDANGKNVQRVTFQGSYNSAPAWSPDGQWIAHESRVGGQFDIWLTDPDGRVSVPIVDHPLSDEGPSWSPDGRKIAFGSNRRGRYDIYSVDANGSNLTQLTSKSGDNTRPAWGPYAR